MKAYGDNKKKWGNTDDFVRKSDEVNANPKRKISKKRLSSTLKTRERRNNKIKINMIAAEEIRSIFMSELRDLLDRYNATIYVTSTLDVISNDVEYEIVVDVGITEIYRSSVELNSISIII